MPSVGAGGDDESCVGACHWWQPQRHAAVASAHATPRGKSRRATTATSSAS